MTNKKIDEELDAETEKELMELPSPPIKSFIMIIAIIISLLCFFVFNLRIIGILIILVISAINYCSSKKDLERYNNKRTR